MKISGERTDIGPVGATGWTDAQREHLARCIECGDCITYLCSDAQGRPAWYQPDDFVWPGMIQELDQALEFGARMLYGTDQPHRWYGARVWVVSLAGEVKFDDDAKLGALRREIIGEVLPDHAWDESCGVRVGRQDLAGSFLCNAYLEDANLEGADLRTSDLRVANLCGANLRNAKLWRANLGGANLWGANLEGATLGNCNLGGANLRDADLRFANLYGANLRDAKLLRANLHSANLQYAELCDARLQEANLAGVDLLDTHTNGANFDSAYYPTGDVPYGWRRTKSGKLARSAP
jgi:hypothetical protein